MKRSMLLLYCTAATIGLMQAQSDHSGAILTSADMTGEVLEDDGASEMDVITAGFDPALIRSDDGLVVWPVPAQDELHIYCAGGSEGNLPFEIVSMSGRVVLRGSIPGGIPSMIEVEGLAPGDHLLRVVDGSGIRQILFSRTG